MPWTKSDYPPAFNNLSDSALEMAITVANEALEFYEGDESRAIPTALSAVEEKYPDEQSFQGSVFVDHYGMVWPAQIGVYIIDIGEGQVEIMPENTEVADYLAEAAGIPEESTTVVDYDAVGSLLDDAQHDQLAMAGEAFIYILPEDLIDLFSLGEDIDLQGLYPAPTGGESAQPQTAFCVGCGAELWEDELDEFGYCPTCQEELIESGEYLTPYYEEQ